MVEWVSASRGASLTVVRNCIVYLTANELAPEKMARN